MKQARVTAIILSGGKGTRLKSDIPKQYIRVKNRAIISYSLEIIANHPYIESIVIVAADEWHQFILDEMKGCVALTKKFIGFANPGDNRQLSVWNALELIKHYFGSNNKDSFESDKLVMIHDAARPNISADLISRLVDSYIGHDGVMPAEIMKNTIYSSDDGVKITGLLDRSKVFAGHTPELFDFAKYYQANQDLLPDRIKAINGSSEPALLAGMDIVMVDNDVDNYKITTKEDLERFTK